MPPRSFGGTKLIHSAKEFNITFTNFLHSLIGIFSVVTTLEFQVSQDDNNEIVDYKCNLAYTSKYISDNITLHTPLKIILSCLWKPKCTCDHNIMDEGSFTKKFYNTYSYLSKPYTIWKIL
jgi:hypothetical protein